MFSIKKGRSTLGFALLLVLLCQCLIVPMFNLVQSAQAADPTILSSTPKWTVTGMPNGESGVLIADINKDGYEEVIRASAGRIYVYSGTTGATLWWKSDPALSDMAKPQMADLDGDGFLEIIVNIAHGAMAWRFPNGVISQGTIYWRNNTLSMGDHKSSPVVADIDGSGHPTVFVASLSTLSDSENGSLDGMISSLRYDGQVLHQAFTWRPCFGGLSLADADQDGHFEVFMGDRNSGYGDGGYGRGLRCFWAENLTTKWERADILCSSHCPVLADINHDGRLEVMAGQNGGFHAVDSRDGSDVRPYSFNATSFPLHFQPSCYDLDLDGNPEMLMADGHDATSDDVVIWDLTQWKEDGRVSVGKCYYGPKAADMTGDGIMELIACSYGGVYIIDHANFTVLDSVTNLGPNTYASRLTYAVVQDIDNDGLLELVVSSFSGSSGTGDAHIWAFDTRAPKPAVRARSEVQHYSERRLGAAEYVPKPSLPTAPVVSNPSPANGAVNVPLGLTQLTFSLKDYQHDLMTYTVTTNPNIVVGSGSGSGYDGTYSVPVSNLQYDTTYSWQVSVTAGTDTTLATYNFTTQGEPGGDDVVFDWSFDMGNLVNKTWVNSAGSNRNYKAGVNYTVGYDPNRPGTNGDKHWWFYFSMDNVAGKTVTITIENGTAADYDTSTTNGNRWPQIEPVYSFDNVNWQRVPLSGVSFDRTARSFTIQITIPAGYSKVWLAPLPPYNIARRDALFAEFASSPYLNVTSLGATPGGQQLKVAAITDPAYSDEGKFKSYVIAQQHPGEVPGSWNAEGLIRFLLSDDPTAVAIRRSYIFKIIPIVNVDAVYQGISRYTPVRADGYQYDLNRDWVNRRTPEIQMIYADISAFQPDSFNDFHSTINTEQNSEKEALTYTWAYTNPTVVNFTNIVKSVIGGWPQTWIANTGSTYAAPQVHTLLGIAESVSWENPHDELRTNPGVKLTVNDWMAWGAGWAKGNYLYFGNATGTLATATEGSGTVSKVPDQTTYAYGTSVQLTATPAAGWNFSGWTGNLTGTTNPATIVINGTLSVTAHFIPTGVNVPPTVSAPQPAGGATNVPISTSKLNFTIADFNGDVMDYYVSTTPNIGSSSATGVTGGTYSVSVSGLSYTTTYTWWVNVTDRKPDSWTNMSYTFTTESIPLLIDYSFESGSIGSYTVTGSQIDFSIVGEPVVNTPGTTYTYWTYFEVSNVQDRTVTFRITNAANIDFLTVTSQERQLVYSYDGENWLRFPTGTYSGGVYTFSTTFTGYNDVYVATFFPFTYTKMMNYIASIDPSPYVETSILGQSEQGRDIKLVKITNPAISETSKQTIYIIGRQHASETCSSYMIKGLIDFLLTNDPVAQRSRDAFVYYIVPMVNPDGVFLGKSRVTSENRDPNRDWAGTDSVEINIVRANIDAVDASNGIDFFLDWHNQMDDTSWYNWIYSPPGNTFFPILSKWTDFDSQTSPGVGSTSARGYVTTYIQPDFMATVEPTPHLYTWTQASLEQQGMYMLQAINEYYPAAPPEFGIVDSEFDASVDSADLRANSTSQDWYESRGGFSGGNASLLVLNETDVGGNAGKKAGLLNYGISQGAYLTQEFSPQSGTFSVSFDIYIDRIQDNGNYDRAGHIYIGNDAITSNAPTGTGSERFVLLAFYDSTPGTDGDLQLRARTIDATSQTWSNTALWPLVTSGLSYDHWYNVRVVLDVAGGAYDVYVDDVLVGDNVAKMFNYTAGSVTHLTFAADSDARGDFYVDNVYAPAAQQYTLTVSTTGSGSVTKSPDKATYNSGESVHLTAVAASGWSFSGWSGALSGTDNPATIVMDADKTVSALFTQITHTITASAGPGGSITPSGSVTVNHGADQEFTVNPDSGYKIADVLVDGESVGAVPSYTFINVVTDRTITASFEAETNADPVVNYVHVWGYPGGLLDPAGSINSGQMVRIFTGVTDVETASDLLTVTIKYKAQSDSVWTSTVAQWEPLYGGYWYFDWVIPGGVSSGLYDVTVEAFDGAGGFVSVTEYGEFTVVSSNTNPVVTYVHVWGYPGGLLDPAGSISSGQMVRIFAGVMDAETASSGLTVKLSYKQQSDSLWTLVSASWEPLYGGYWFYDWVIPSGASAGLYDVMVEVSDPDGGVAVPLTGTGMFTVVAEGNSAPVIDTYNPLTDFTMPEGGSQLFTVTYHDPDGNPLSVSWLLDLVEVSTVDSYTYSPSFSDSGLHTVKVVVSDGSLTDEHSWSVTVTDAAPPLLVDSTFDASADSATLRTNGADQDWYESRGSPLASALTLDETDVAGNTGKKAALKTYSDTSANSVYLTQNFSSPQTGGFSVSCDINIDQIFLDSKNLCRGAYIFLGDELPGTTTPNGGGLRRFVQLVFWDSTPGTDGDMKLMAREYNNNASSPQPDQPWLDASTWTEVKSGLSYDTWINVRIDVDFGASTYDVYVDGVLAKAGLNRYEQYVSTSITHISFAIGGVSDTGFGRGDFYVDNVYSPAS